jgi:aspartate/methionine/tyrosine aminotransferase
MEIVKAADALQASGRSIIHMSIGEPDFGAPEPVQRAAQAAISAGRTGYTAALGIGELRARISTHYEHAYRLSIPAERIVITAGASAALLLALAALLERDAELLMPDPSYPCNRHFAAAFEGRARLVPCGPESRFQLTAESAAAAWGAQTRGVLLASPSNPTGTTIPPAQLSALLALVKARGGFAIVDEIYQGLTYDDAPRSALAHDDDVVVINSFSKYFCMTGWRLGWLVAPTPLVPVIEKLAQNLFICASAISQRAAIACFEPETLAIYEARRQEFARRRDYLVPALRDLGFGVPVKPDGAFYVYADISRFGDDSWAFAFDVLERTGVCLVPGRDFGSAATRRYVRISYATSMDQLGEAVDRLRRYLPQREPAAA